MAFGRLHCVQNELGSELDPRFDHLNEAKDPLQDNNTLWVRMTRPREYQPISQGRIRRHVEWGRGTPYVMVAGIASEFCVAETTVELVASGVEGGKERKKHV